MYLALSHRTISPECLDFSVYNYIWLHVSEKTHKLSQTNVFFVKEKKKKMYKVYFPKYSKK